MLKLSRVVVPKAVTAEPFSVRCRACSAERNTTPRKFPVGKDQKERSLTVLEVTHNDHSDDLG